MSAAKQKLFLHPNKPMQDFDTVLGQVSQLPVQEKGSSQFLKATYDFNGKQFALACQARILQKGKEGSPLVAFLPWYGGKSRYVRAFLGDKSHKGWTHVGIDIFNTREDFQKVITTAVGSQYAYALVLCMLAEQVRRAHCAHRKVGVVGFSYGANVLSAYATRRFELPDAIVAVEGGSILQITLQTKYRGHDSDPRSLTALTERPETIPLQKTVAGKAAAVSAAVINPADKVVILQEELWKNAANKMYIQGGHFTAPLLKRRKIKRFAREHFERLLGS